MLCTILERTQRSKNKQSISIAKKARYALNELKVDTREVYVKNMKKKITSKPTLKRELLRAFRSCCNPLAEKIKPIKLTNAVFSTQKLLNRVLKARKQSVGELLRCVRSACDDFGESHHTASSEPFFYDQSYTIVKHTTAIVVDDSDQSYAIVEHKSVIVVDDSGRCVILVSAGCICENHHRLVAHDEAILKCFPIRSVIYRLWHFPLRGRLSKFCEPNPPALAQPIGQYSVHRIY